MLYHAQKTNPKVDFAVLNNGGVRLPSLSKGPISVGKIYELMPFENSLVILTIPGDSLLQLFKIMGFKGGWPCAGIQYTMDHKNVSKVLFDNNRTLDSKQNYTIAINDYLANGGDNCTMLKNAAQTATGLTIRDAVLTYLEFLHNKGQKITLPTKIRIQNVE
jgi:2',3'-cyclic-nucleotide 2'-phosphodiesterase (5'-nucleotidase family)